ncbi:oxidoreductase [Deminuibacter soli]|uniref:SDR family NAD(P)-dependent oxidoreductase n=1 Tax=Deminuibacter soli TaxID=2291815 RepID=A0A3E1NI30_9BACT|nr:oxidoreductase [Deminuibacter soli]RFM27438.1 SDR family NAD(P)-dependent oxidoreductase [Deminuibacter soli]
MSNNKVWYITGASKGFGLELVQQLLAAGNRVAATSRDVETLKSSVTANTAQFLPLAVNLSSAESIGQSIQQTVAHFGRIDVVVNNAGYGLLGTPEELHMDEIRRNFEVNVFGTIQVVKAALPYLRTQGSGHILNFSSIAGFQAASATAVYSATKFAVEGFSESLAQDVKEFGIHVTIVAPGAFRTNFLAGDSLAVPQNSNSDYKLVRERIQLFQKNDGLQNGDPHKGVAAILKAAAAAQPPLRLFLGADAYQRAGAKIAAVQTDMYTWKAVATATAVEQ